MGPGTLYGSLGRMIDAGLIGKSDKRVDPAMDDERRVYYEFTGLGRSALVTGFILLLPLFKHRSP